MPTTTHTADMIVEDHRAPSFISVIYDWTEEIWDSTEDWDMPWTSQRDVERQGASTGSSFTVRTGNALHAKWWDMSDASRGPNGPSNIYFGLGGDNITDYVDSSAGTFPTQFDDSALFCDNDGDLWTLSRKSRTVADVTKLDTATNQFESISTRTAQTFRGTSYKAYGWKAHQDGNDLHIVWTDICLDTSYYKAFYYSLWNMSTETWTVSDEKIYEHTTTSTPSWLTQGNTCALTVRPSDSQVIVLFGHSETTQGTQTSSPPAYGRRTGTDSWTITTMANSETNFRYWYWPSLVWCVLGASSRVHFFYYGSDTSTNHVRHRSLSSANVLDTDAVASVTDTTAMGQDYSASSYARVVDGSDVYISLAHVLPNGSGSEAGRDTGIINIKSGANPTMNKQAFAGTEGVNHHYRRDLTEVTAEHSVGIMFTDEDGLANMIRPELDWVIVGSPDVIDGQGGFLYHQDDKTGYDFDVLRGHLGYFQDPVGSRIDGTQNETSDQSEWLYPSIAANYFSVDSGTEAGMETGGYFKKGSTEYIYHVSSKGGTSATSAWMYYVYELPEVPKNVIDHTTDMIVKKTETPEHTTDMRIVALAGTQTIDHFTDMVAVERVTTDHTTDMIAVDVRTKDHTVDMLLSEEVIFTVAVTIAYTVDVSYTLEKPPPIQVTNLRSITSYSTGVSSGSGGTSYSRRKKRRIDRD